ncbi:MAG: type I 3-dehydroquinate dehydratase [Lachnospirales bacterium]
MQNYVQVRNIKIGEGMPKICVPLVEKNKQAFLNSAKELKNINLDLVELRIDHFEEVENLDEVKDLTKGLREILGEIPILFTFRSLKEGGEKEVSVDYYKTLNIEITKTGYVDLIDVELFTGDDIVKEIVLEAHNLNVKVVMSNHDFDKTPEREEIVKRLCRMQELNADLPKIAVMPKSTTDVLTLLCATDDMVTKYAKTPIITMSMAGLGVISRLSGETFGSALTFGAAKVASAPGQVEVNKLSEILKVLHNSK